jgi:alpha-D-ribose 1-methylphosphonate 5-triphosphate synthase subunit PhnH
MSLAAFADPVFQSQAAFRAVLRAMSSPGSVRPLGADVTPPAPLRPAAAAVLLALCDFETPLWLSPAYADSDVAAWLKFHTGAPVAADRASAAFALIDLSQDTLDLAAFAQGTATYPDRSTTVVAEVEALAAGAGLRLVGPGVKGEASLSIAPLPADFAKNWRLNNEGFPLGVDMVFAAPGAVAALPRTTRIPGSV